MKYRINVVSRVSCLLDDFMMLYLAPLMMTFHFAWWRSQMYFALIRLDTVFHTLNERKVTSAGNIMMAWPSALGPP